MDSGPARRVSRFARSTAPLGDLALAYVGLAMAAVLDVAAVLSAGSGARWRGRRVANAVRTGSRPDPGERPGDCLAPDRDPAGAVTASMTLTFALLLAFGLAGTGALDAFFYLATTAALCLLMDHVLVSVSALRLYVLSSDKRRLPAAILPLGGAIAALYVLFAI